MQHELPILINITVALLAAFVGGFLARRLKLPSMVGYMLAGIAIGPFTPGFIGDLSTIQQLAELGVIFLLFDVGLHFSLRDLWAVRDTVISGALIQLVVITGLGLLLAHLWGWSLAAGILLGLAITIASTVVMIRNLMDRGWHNRGRIGSVQAGSVCAAAGRCAALYHAQSVPIPGAALDRSTSAEGSRFLVAS